MNSKNINASSISPLPRRQTPPKTFTKPTTNNSKNSYLTIRLLALRKFLAEMDLPLFFFVMLLLAIGMSSTFIATFSLSSKLTGNPFYMASKQSLMMILGFSSIMFFSFYRIEHILNRRIMLFLVSIGLLIMVFIPGVGKEVAGAKRWVEFMGIGFQPSELAKTSMLLLFASMLGKKLKDKDITYLKTGLPPFLLLLVTCLLIALQPDLSTAIIFFITTSLLFFSSKIPLRYLLINIALTFPMAVIFLQSRRYYLDRLLFFNPNDEPAGRGYHLLQSLAAFKRGNYLGEEIGASIIQLTTLPDAHNDFIFSVIGNVSGILGIGLVLLLFIGITLRGIKIAFMQKTTTNHYLALGITYLISLQALLHMLVTTGMAPTTGISLPFLSYGGSSMLVNCAMIGILLRLSRRKQN